MSEIKIMINADPALPLRSVAAEVARMAVAMLKYSDETPEAKLQEFFAPKEDKKQMTIFDVGV